MPSERPYIVRRHRAALRRIDRCIADCGRKRDGRSPRCAPCRKANASAAQRCYARKVAEGECVRCPARAVPGRRECRSCLDGQAERRASRKMRAQYAAADAAQMAEIATSRPGAW